MAKEGDRQLLLGPVIDKDGNVTFKAIHEKEQLYLLGSFHEWNVEKAIEMENKDGIHTTKVALNPGTYEYSFLTDITNASTSFAAPLNPAKDGEKSILHVPGIILERLPEAVEANSKSILEGEFFNENAKTNSLKGAKWT